MRMKFSPDGYWDQIEIFLQVFQLRTINYQPFFRNFVIVQNTDYDDGGDKAATT